MSPPSRADIILVVDDSPETVRLLTDVLQAAGMTVMVATGGAEALALAAQHTPDIVLMDAVMPSMDGFETCRRMKELTGFDSVPIIFMTGLRDPEASFRGFEAGGVDYVTKPIVIDDMVARMRVHIKNARKMKSAYHALDAAEQFLVCANKDGRILWFTPRAYRLLQNRFDNTGGDIELPRAVLKWLKTRLEKTAPSDPPWDETVFSTKGRKSWISFVGEGEGEDILFKISDAAPKDEWTTVLARFNLTMRETEVLSWVVKGKSTPDIALILAISPRTVEKHIELIFQKLGVVNRIAATALIYGLRAEERP